MFLIRSHEKNCYYGFLGLSTFIPFVASAHEHGTYQIGKNYYQIVIGLLNEPVAVDDKTGVDLTVSKCFNSACMAKMSADGDMDGPAGTPVTGLDQTLKVELQAGGQTKQFALNPQYGRAELIRPGSIRPPLRLTRTISPVQLMELPSILRTRAYRKEVKPRT